ncbi:305_t:CDS:2, partial [Acaulospora colombiana]
MGSNQSTIFVEESNNFRNKQMTNFHNIPKQQTEEIYHVKDIEEVLLIIQLQKFLIQARQQLKDKKEEKIYQPPQILVSIQKSVPDIVPTFEKLEAKYLNTYLKEWIK